MSIFSFLRGTDINQAIHNCRQTPGAVLVDVRTPQEYQEGHISGSINVPLQSLGRISSLVSRKDTPVFVYCQSGGRSRQAAAGRPRAFWDRWAIPVCKTQEALCPTPVRL